MMPRQPDARMFTETWAMYPTARSYAIKLSSDDFAALLNAENVNITVETLVFKMTHEKDISFVWYALHLGPYVYLTIDNETDCAGRRLAILAFIKAHIKECYELLAKAKPL